MSSGDGAPISGPDESRLHADDWRSRYAQNTRRTDAAVILGVVALAQVTRFGTDLMHPVGSFGFPVTAVSVVLVIGWIAALRIAQASDKRLIGAGAVEYTRILQASAGMLGGIAIVDLVLRLSVARGYIAVAVPLGALALLISRWMWRKHIRRGRSKGRYQMRVLIVGTMESSSSLHRRLSKHPDLGYRTVGIVVPDESSVDDSQANRGLPVYGDIAQIRHAIERSGATAIAVTSADVLGHSAIRELSWHIEGMGVEMMVVPGILDVAGPRITMRPEPGLPLLMVEEPRYQGASRVVKQLFDRSIAISTLILAAPVLVACAVAVKLDSKGPVFYAGERIGINNQTFRMWKFRSMVVGAHAMRQQLAGNDDGNGVLFKMKDDPRVTRVGRLLRKYSLDELPQLFNVVGGSMSLVGPRPPLPEEAAVYDDVVTRRMLVRPGITGLWQVSGRSDLSWEDSVHLDLSYVENWSLAGDILILVRTVKTVALKSGAY